MHVKVMKHTLPTKAESIKNIYRYTFIPQSVRLMLTFD